MQIKTPKRDPLKIRNLMEDNRTMNRPHPTSLDLLTKQGQLTPSEEGRPCLEYIIYYF